jgi:hypothetical protein
MRYTHITPFGIRMRMRSPMAALIWLSTIAASAQETSRQIPFTLATSLPPDSIQSVTVQLQATDGIVVFSEAYPTMAVDSNGQISFLFGSQTSTGLDPAQFPSGSSRFLDVVDPTSTSVLVAGRIALNALPFALSPGPQGPVGPAGPQGPPGQPGLIQSVTAADGSVAVGGTPADRTVAVASNGIGNAHIANGGLNPAKITGTAATLGTNTFDGTQVINGGAMIAGLNPEGGVLSARAVGDAYVMVSAAPSNRSAALAYRKNNLNRWLVGADSTAESGSSSGSDFRILRYDDAGGIIDTPLLIKRSTGDVGIGINNYPVARLDVVGSTGSGGIGVFGSSFGGLAGSFQGNVRVTGTLTKGGGSFKIDHPLDPANKYLSHSFVESPDMMNIYNGNAVLDENGEAWISLPEWFDALNRDIRYQLTAIAVPANLYIAEKVRDNRFKIAGGKPRMEVSWQVTGVRRDPYAEAHRIQVEEEKPQSERGFYLHPDVYGQSREKDIEYVNGVPGGLGSRAEGPK